MTRFESAVLAILRAAEQPLGWHQIETRLSNVSLDERPPLPSVLAGMVESGLVEVGERPGVPSEVYTITEIGRAGLLRSGGDTIE